MYKELLGLYLQPGRYLRWNIQESSLNSNLTKLVTSLVSEQKHASLSRRRRVRTLQEFSGMVRVSCWWATLLWRMQQGKRLPEFSWKRLNGGPQWWIFILHIQRRNFRIFRKHCFRYPIISLTKCKILMLDTQLTVKTTPLQECWDMFLPSPADFFPFSLLTPTNRTLSFGLKTGILPLFE